jgi:hypothetical protein
MGAQRGQERSKGFPRRVVPIYLESLPATAENVEGIALNISPDRLYQDEKEFNLFLDKNVDDQHPMVRFLDDLRSIVDKIREQGRFPKAQRADSRKCVREMLTAVFCYLKTTVDRTLKPRSRL